ncbi:MAG: hypothetical protein K8E24_015150 [Methanobacterium paludis]|nr:hypothetical protein [Methanobacterium paludis]
MVSLNLYPTKNLNLNGNKVKIEPYRVAEIRDYVAPMDDLQMELGKLVSKMDLYQKDELDEENINKIAELGKEANKIKLEAQEISYKLAQLGLKRALIKEASNLVGVELDKFEDMGIDEGTANLVSGTMVSLANKNIPKVADTKNQLKEELQKRSGRSSSNGSSQ